MLRGEKFRQLRSKNSEGRHAKQSREVAGAGVVPDKPIGAGERVQQRVEIAPGVGNDGDLPAGAAQQRREFGESLGRPEAHGVPRAHVNDDAAAGTRTWRDGGQLMAKRGGEGAPVVGAMRVPGCGKRRGQQAAGSNSGKSNSAPDAGERKQQVIPRIASGTHADPMVLGAQHVQRAPQFPPRPAQESIFSAERRPWRGERHEFNPGRKAGEEGPGMGFGEQGDARPKRGLAQKRHGEREVAKAP